MEIRYYNDPETGQPHIHEHGVTEAEAEWVLAHPGEDEACSGGSRQALGQTVDGRYLRVVYVPDEEGDGVLWLRLIRSPASSSKPSGGGKGDVGDERTAVPRRLG